MTITSYGPALDELRAAAGAMVAAMAIRELIDWTPIDAEYRRLREAVAEYDRAKLALENYIHAAAMAPAPGDDSP